MVRGPVIVHCIIIIIIQFFSFISFTGPRYTDITIVSIGALLVQFLYLSYFGVGFAI